LGARRLVCGITHAPKRGTPPGGNPAARRWCYRGGSALERVGALTGLARGGFDGQAELLAQGSADEAADAVSLPSGGSHDGLEGGAARPVQQFENLGGLATLARRGGLLGGGGPFPRLGPRGRDSGRLWRGVGAFLDSGRLFGRLGLGGRRCRLPFRSFGFRR